MTRSLAMDRQPEICPSAAARATSWMLSAFAQLALWQARAAERHHIRELDERLLRDVGLTRTDVEHMTGRPLRYP